MPDRKAHVPDPCAIFWQRPECPGQGWHRKALIHGVLFTMGPLTLERTRRVVFEHGLTSFQQGLEPTGQGYVVFLAEDWGEMENAPFFTPLFSSSHNCRAGWAARGTHFWSPFFLWDSQASRRDCGPGLEGDCFQSDRVRRRFRAPRLRTQPVAAPALRTCARCLRGSWALRCAARGPVPAPGAWGGFQEPRCEVERPPRERSGLPRSLQGARGPRTGAPRPQLLCFSHFPAFWLQLMGSGNIWEELQKTILSPAVGRITCGIFPPLCGQSSFHPCLYFPGVGFCSLWTLARLLGAYWLWAIRARASCQGLCPVQSLREEEVRVQGQERGPGEVGQKKLQRGKGCDKCRQRLFRNWKFSNFLSVLVFLVHFCDILTSF